MLAPYVMDLTAYKWNDIEATFPAVVHESHKLQVNRHKPTHATYDTDDNMDDAQNEESEQDEGINLRSRNVEPSRPIENKFSRWRSKFLKMFFFWKDIHNTINMKSTWGWRLTSKEKKDLWATKAWMLLCPSLTSLHGWMEVSTLCGMG